MTIARKRTRMVVFLVLAMSACWLVVHGRSADAANANVTIAGFAFTPASVTVNVGDTVTWTHNQGSTPHTVTSDAAGVMDSGSLSNGATFAKTFGASGSFAYHCDIHPGMTGTVVVTGAAATAVPATNTAPAPTAAATAVPVATATVAATSPATAGATSTAASATATQATTGPTSPSAPSSPSASPTGASGTASSSSPQASPSTAGLIPATGNEPEADDDGGSAAPVIIGVVVGLGLLAGVGGMLLRRRGSGFAP